MPDNPIKWLKLFVNQVDNNVKTTEILHCWRRTHIRTQWQQESKKKHAEREREIETKKEDARKNSTIELEFVEWLVTFCSWAHTMQMGQSGPPFGKKNFSASLHCKRYRQCTEFVFERRFKSAGDIFFGLRLLFDETTLVKMLLPFFSLSIYTNIVCMRLVLTKCA